MRRGDNPPPSKNSIKKNYTKRDLQRYVNQHYQKVTSLYNVRQIGGNKVVDFPYKVVPTRMILVCLLG
jgi:hypothetical protein